jgi:hypothetical protein
MKLPKKQVPSKVIGESLLLIAIAMLLLIAAVSFFR